MKDRAMYHLDVPRTTTGTWQNILICKLNCNVWIYCVCITYYVVVPNILLNKNFLKSWIKSRTIPGGIFNAGLYIINNLPILCPGVETWLLDEWLWHKWRHIRPACTHSRLVTIIPGKMSRGHGLTLRSGVNRNVVSNPKPVIFLAQYLLLKIIQDFETVAEIVIQVHPKLCKGIR